MNCNTSAGLTIAYYIKIAMDIIFISAPILLLVLGTIDILKVVASDSEKSMKSSISTFLKRVIICVIILILPALINLVVSVFGFNIYNECFTKATKANIERLEKAEEENKLKERQELLERKRENQKTAEYNRIKERIKTASSEEYDSIKSEIDKISDDAVRKELLDILNSTIVPKNTSLEIQPGVFERSDYDKEMRYVEVIPEDATTDLPLIIYLHGIWSYSSFSTNAPNYKITNYVKSGNAYNYGKFILIIPRFVLAQGDENNRVTWQTNQGKEQTAKLKGLIDFIVDKYKINNRKIIITGVSLGGDGVWNMVESYPNLFSAAVPVSGCTGNKMVASNYVSTPIIAYHGTGYNEDAYKQCVPAAYNKIKAAGGNIELRVQKNYSHPMMQNIYSDNNGEIFKWMLEQER